VNGLEFTDDQNIAAKLKNWMVNTANQKLHGTTKKVPWEELVKKEQVALQSLPFVIDFHIPNHSIRPINTTNYISSCDFILLLP
jgi:hypothetical protein